MTAFDTATALFHACESLQGAEGCAPFMADGAGFSAQSEPIAELNTLADYADWMKATGEGPLAGCGYELHASGFDEATQTALFFGTFNGTHNGEGGPVAATGQSTSSHYVYVMQMNADGKVSHMTKIWNAPWAMRELGWG